MNEPLPGEPFPSTHWSVLDSGEADAQLRADICLAYKPPLTAYLRQRQGLLPVGDECGQVVADFLNDKILTGPLLKQAVARRQHDSQLCFRAYLLRSFRNYLIDRRRQESRELPPRSGDDDEVDAFGRIWAIELLNQACLQARDECAARNPMHWNAFTARHFEGWSYRRMRNEFGLKTDNQVAGLVQRGEKVFAKHLQRLLHIQTLSEEEYQQSISDLLGQLGAGAGAGLVALPLLYPLDNKDPCQLRSLDVPQMESSQRTNSVGTSLRRVLLPEHPALALQEGLALELQGLLPQVQPTAGAEVPRTIGELLDHPTPQVSWLVHLKDRAKAASADPEDVLPQATATWLYFTAIAVALVRCGQLISSTPPKDLLRGVTWAAERSWTPSTFIPLLRQTCGKLTSS